jgi:hypothetical protein
VLASDGALNVATSLADDEGVDLIFFREAGHATLSIQVKARFVDAKVVDRDKKVMVDLTDTTFHPRDDFYILVVVVDQHAADITYSWFVPSVAFADKTGGNTLASREVVDFRGGLLGWKSP